MPQRLFSINHDEVKQLQLMQKHSPISEDFWQITESAIKNKDAFLKLYKCDCCELFFIADSEYKRINKLKDTEAKCFCEKFLKHSLNLNDSLIESKIREASILLKANERQKAMSLCFDILPIDSFPSFDYALWQLQLQMLTKQYIEANIVRKRVFYQHQYLKELSSVFNIAKKKNLTELQKLISTFSQYQQRAGEKLINALSKHIESSDIFEKESYKRISNDFVPSNQPDLKNEDLVKRSIQYHLDSYHAYFEIPEYYFFITNLINISKGNNFLKDVSKLTIVRNGKLIPLGNRGKGNYVQWLIENSSSSLSKIISLALDSTLRNDTSSHNDYVVDTKSKFIINSSTNHKYSYPYIRNKLSRLRALVNAIVVVSSLSEYEDHPLLPYSGIFSMNMRFNALEDKPINSLEIYQFWSNANLDVKGESFKLASFKYLKKGFMGKDVVLFSPGPFIPYPTSAIIQLTDKLPEWFENLVKKGFLDLKRIVITPKVSVFRKHAKTEYSNQGFNFYVLGYSEHKVPINIKLVKKLVKRLKRLKNLPEMKLERLNLLKPIENSNSKYNN